MSMDEQRRLGRAKNAVLDYFERRLSVPKIFLDATWNGSHVDVLAINRDGIGDVHVVLLYVRSYSDDSTLNIPDELSAISALVNRLQTIPAQFKYIGAIHPFVRRENELITAAQHGIPSDFLDASFADDGLGRIGFLSISTPAVGEVTASLDLKPERFRAVVGELADQFVSTHHADWEVRA